jgi:hypothetical protein
MKLKCDVDSLLKKFILLADGEGNMESDAAE